MWQGRLTTEARRAQRKREQRSRGSRVIACRSGKRPLAPVSSEERSESTPPHPLHIRDVSEVDRAATGAGPASRTSSTLISSVTP